MKNMLGNLILNDIYCDEINIRSLESVENSELYVSITLDIGFKNEQGSDLFYFKLSTPEALLCRDFENYILLKNRIIIVKYFDFQIFIQSISDIIRTCSRETWSESVNELIKYFAWEYEQ